MISGVTRQIGGRSETFRMTTRAMMAIEDRFNKGLIEVLQGLESGFRISDIVALVSECAEDGKGVDVSRASEIVDEIGVTEAGGLLGELAEAAFPEAKKGKNAKGAARSK
ncbi:GTA-gp10 family protein [Sulfitobacter sp. R18_2]|uniref:GTA-gp10 family protein n=1 Tax=Sulfitobacter sp. R18_2 TaxID=2821105 RepID=UPI0032B011C8